MSNKTNQLILASSSIYRKRLLERLNIDFEAIASHIDETPLDNENPEALTKRLSIQKAQHIAKQKTDAWVIGSDQVAILHGQQLGKPGNQKNAIAQLKACSNQEVIFITGLCLTHVNQSKTFYESSQVKVKFLKLTDKQIENYINLDKPFDCAGSFKVESMGVSLFESVISDDPTSLEGLPLILLCKLLRKAGVDLLT